jgi:hypothetical protein
MKEKIVLSITVIIFIISSVFIFRNCHQKYEIHKKDIELINSLSDTLLVWRDKDSLQHAKISVIETENTKLFTSLDLKEKELIELQNTVKKYEKRLKEQGSVTIFETKTKFDTIYQTDIIDNSNWCDTIKNNWIDVQYCRKDSIAYLGLTIRNDYEVIIGKEKKLTYAEIINKNPYSETTSARTYQVQLPKQKRFGVGLHIGTGLTHDLKFRTYIGIGLNYNVIEF